MSPSADREDRRAPRPSAEPGARTAVAGGRGVLVAVIDSGWDRTRDDARVLSGISFVGAQDELKVETSSDDDDRQGHGTACARIVLEVAPEARILPVRVFGRRLETSVPQLVAGLRFAMERRVDVISLSLATTRADAIQPLYRCCEEATRHGAIIIAAARRPTQYAFPAAFANVIGVEAVPVSSPLDIRYRSDVAIECGACGLPPDTQDPDGGAAVTASNSGAAARVAGMVAVFRGEQPEGGLKEARLWLAARATNAVYR